MTKPTPAETIATALDELVDLHLQNMRDARQGKLTDASFAFAVGALRGSLASLIPEPVTVAVRVCDTCNELIGVSEWRFSNAHPGETHTITHGRCDACLGPDDEEAEATCSGS